VGAPVEKTAGLPRPRLEYHDKESFTIWESFKVVGTDDASLDGAMSRDLDHNAVAMPSNKAVRVLARKIFYYGLYEVIARRRGISGSPR